MQWYNDKEFIHIGFGNWAFKCRDDWTDAMKGNLKETGGDFRVYKADGKLAGIYSKCGLVAIVDKDAKD